MKLRRWTRNLASALVILVLAAAVAVGIRRQSGNFGAVVAGQIYRSGQMSCDQLKRTLDEYRIRTVLNLRGPNSQSAWYRAERETTLQAGAMQIDVAMASDQWLSRDQARAIVEILDRCEKPMLIHCEWGAERTGLISAFARLLERGTTFEQARAEFSVTYLFLPVRDGLKMRGHLDRYARWLADRQTSHSPEAFRAWIASGYRPGAPCRELWPYDPYPLATISRPSTRR
jgi:protein tyrosine/serine phosphatase